VLYDKFVVTPTTEKKSLNSHSWVQESWASRLCRESGLPMQLIFHSKELSIDCARAILASSHHILQEPKILLWIIADKSLQQQVTLPGGTTRA
jgi:hypothetical protein